MFSYNTLSIAVKFQFIQQMVKIEAYIKYQTHVNLIVWKPILILFTMV